MAKTITIEDRRPEGEEAIAKTGRIYAARLFDQGLTVDDLGSETVPLRRDDDDRAAIANAVREALAKTAEFTVREAQEGEADGEVAVEAEELAAEEEEKRELSSEVQAALLKTLNSRFDANSARHEGVSWENVKASLEATPALLWSIQQMEQAGHSPDVYAEDHGAYYFGTCSEEAPTTSRDIVYDRAAQDLLDEGACNGNAVEIATQMGIILMSEAQYRHLQETGEFDKSTWVWLNSDHLRGDRLDKVQKSGNALFGARYRGRVAVDRNRAGNHVLNGAFRGSLRVPKLES